MSTAYRSTWRIAADRVALDLAGERGVAGAVDLHVDQP
jgi:hypothetical protein